MQYALTHLWDMIWFMAVVFMFLAYLMALFSIIGDLFRDRELSGGLKAVWLIALVFFPFITALVYLIVRGSGMADRAQAQASQTKAATDDYIRTVASASPADEIAKAKSLLDAGTISESEYAALKAKVLG
ncbi:MAG: SHOCT domain-containing protein [Propionicimonas sp.]